MPIHDKYKGRVERICEQLMREPIPPRLSGPAAPDAGL
jgi:hypothetical protein